MAVSAPMADNVASTLCYAVGFITGIIFLVISPYNQNRVVRFHAFQSIFMSVGCILISWVLGAIFGAMTIALSGGAFLGSTAIFVLLMMVIRLAFFLLWLYMLVSTYQGKTVVLPVVGPFARTQAGA